MAKADLTPLLLHAVVDAADLQLPPSNQVVVPFRHLAAVVTEAPGLTREGAVDARHVADHREIVSNLAQQRAVLPAPAGVMVKGREALTAWLELHAVTLAEALAFVEGRCAARVHVTRSPDAASNNRPLDAAPVDLDGAAGEVFRVLRRHAAAVVQLRPSATATESETTAAFLVERDRWELFVDAVASERRRDGMLRLRLTGPWPPYDFVKMQFGG